MTTTNTARCIARTITIDGREVRVEATRSPFNDAERVFRAWEPSDFIGGLHGTISSLGLELGYWGLIGTERAGAQLDAEGLRGEARVSRCNELYQANAQRALRAIRAAFPELEEARHYLGCGYELVSSDVQL